MAKTLNRTRDEPWQLKTPPGTADCTMHVDEKDGKKIVVWTVGKKVLHDDARCIDDRVGMLKKAKDRVELAGADEQKAAPPLAAFFGVIALIGCSTPLRDPRPPETRIDALHLVVSIRDVTVNLETDCGIEQSMERREFDVLSERIGQDDWRMIILLNQIPALELFTDTGRFECGIASKAFGSDEAKKK